MNYSRIYTALITKSIIRDRTALRDNVPLTNMERHHILPRAEGGSDDEGNLVRLTVQEHYLAHLLLFKMGFNNQIFSVEAILKDTLNRNRALRFTHPKIRFKRWIRRAIALERAYNLRERKQQANERIQYVLGLTPFINTGAMYGIEETDD